MGPEHLRKASKALTMLPFSPKAPSSRPWLAKPFISYNSLGPDPRGMNVKSEVANGSN